MLDLVLKSLLSLKQYGFLETLKKCILYIKKKITYLGPIKQRNIKKINRKLNKKKIKICIQVHIFYIELIDEIINHLNFMPFPFHCYISTSNSENIAIIENEFRKCKNAQKIFIEKFENRGRDVAPFICQMRNKIYNYEYILHIHTKKSLTSNTYGDDWREYLFNNLLGSSENIYYIFRYFIYRKKTGIIFPETYYPVKPSMLWGTDIEQGKKNVYEFLKKINCETDLGDNPVFTSGNMFWARTKAVKNAFYTGINQNDFPDENNQIDMTLAHAIERSWVYIALYNGYIFLQMNQNNLRE